jgi:hypothetical protein
VKESVAGSDANVMNSVIGNNTEPTAALQDSRGMNAN